ncbi:hypothetical protein BD413DRAFT_491641 [Trametes elegans]|nr:hypothetical protein BD413DRAFT_491641 [Trametes elegans]
MSATEFTTLAGLGLSLNIISVNHSFSSGDESFDSLFSDLTLVSSRESLDAGNPPVEHRSTEAWDSAWSAKSEDSDVESGFNHFEPYVGVPNITDFLPWPTRYVPLQPASIVTRSPSDSPEAVALAQVASREPPTPSVERGYEADMDVDVTTPRAQRRQRRRNAHKLPRQQRHTNRDIEPATEDTPHAPAEVPPAPEAEAEQTVCVAEPTTPGYDSDADSSETDIFHHGPDDENGSYDDEDHLYLSEADEGENEYDDELHYRRRQSQTAATPANIGLGFGLPAFDEPSRIARTDSHAGSDSGSDIFHHGSDDLSDGSFDSDEDHYFLSDPDAEESYPADTAYYTAGNGATWTITDDPSPVENELDEPAPVPAEAEPAQPTAPPRVPFHIEHAPAPACTRYTPAEGFETIDLADGADAVRASSPHLHGCAHPEPDSPALRPHRAADAESPSPIILASPVPCAAFRRFDDVLAYNPWAEDAPEQEGEGNMQYAACHRLTETWTLEKTV